MTRMKSVVDDKSILGFFGEYEFLSNFYDALVWHEGKLYPSSEHAYQASKIPIEFRNDFYYDPTNQKLSHAQTKKEWRKYPPLYSPQKWDEVKYEIMCSIVFSKFYENKYLRLKLMETGDKYLEETNWWKDVYWGVCDGVGENNLGKILMKTRSFWAK